MSAAGGAGDVVFEVSGDLLAVDGTASVTRIAKSDGSVTSAASGVGGGATVLRSVVGAADGRIYAGDAAGAIYRIETDGSASVLVDTGSEPVTGLVFAPNGFGDFGGSLVAAVGADGIAVVDPGDESPSAAPLTSSGEYVDVAFSGATLYALDAANAEIDRIASDGTATTFKGGFSTPVGLGVDTQNGEIVVADAGVDRLRSVALTGSGPVVDLAPYDFSPTAPSGISFDGSGAIAFTTAGSVVVRGASVPPLQPSAFGLVVAGTTVGYGDLEFDRTGQLIAVGNDPGASPGNLLFVLSRGGAFTQLASNIGASGEELLGLAFEPQERTIYVGTTAGNVFRVDSANRVELLVAATPGVPILGLELAPDGFGAFGGWLVATTSDGRVLAIDPDAAVVTAIRSAGDPILTATTTPVPARLPDLVFAEDGTLYVLDSGTATGQAEVPRILELSAGGAVADLGADAGHLLLPDGIEIDDGGKRLLVAAGDDVGGNRLLQVALVGAPTVTQLAVIDIDDGFFPTGLVYDRLGRVAVHGGGADTRITIVSTFPVP